MPAPEIVNLVRELSRQGWKVKPRSKTRYVAFPPDKKHSPVTIPHNPLNVNSFNNCVARCRQRGANLTER